MNPGDRFDRWTLVSQTDPYVHQSGQYQRWLCRCSCGNTKKVLVKLLRSGGSRSCGCIRKEAVSKMWARVKSCRL